METITSLEKRDLPKVRAQLTESLGATGLFYAKIESAETLATADLKRQLGELACALATTNQVEVSEIKVTDRKQSLATSPEAMDFHTDNVTLENPCNLVLLYCAQQAAEGGASLLVDARHTIRTLPDSAQAALEMPQWIWRRPIFIGQGDCPPRAVIEPDDSVRWWKTGLKSPPRQREIATLLNDALANSAHILEYTLRPGELLAIDNKRMVHGRRAFSGGSRLMLRGRVW